MQWTKDAQTPLCKGEAHSCAPTAHNQLLLTQALLSCVAATRKHCTVIHKEKAHHCNGPGCNKIEAASDTESKGSNTCKDRHERADQV